MSDEHAPRLPPSVINCAAYDRAGRRRDIDLEAISDVLAVDDGSFVWIGLYEPDEGVLEKLQEEFGLHDLAIEDAHKAHQRPKLEQYEGSLFVVLRTAQLTGAPRHIDFGETHIFLGERYVVTVRHGSLLSHVNLRARCESTPQLLTIGPGFVLYALMDFVVDQYFPIVEALEEDLQELEEEIFNQKVSRETTARIYALKRDLLTTPLESTHLRQRAPRTASLPSRGGSALPASRRSPRPASAPAGPRPPRA